MEPRWFTNWLTRVGFTFLGGVPEADLWLDNEGDLRLTWGIDWVHIWKGKHEFTLHQGPDNVKQAVPAIELYLKLFCPEVWAALKIGGKDAVETL